MLHLLYMYNVLQKIVVLIIDKWLANLLGIIDLVSVCVVDSVSLVESVVVLPMDR